METPHSQHHAPAASAEELAQSFKDADQSRIDLSGYAFEDWVSFALFWTLCGVIFLQFFTRYVMNDSYAWTEEMARYLLIGVVFVGSSMCVRQNRHIQVDVLYRFLPRLAGRALATLIDLIRISFLGYAVWLTWQVMQRVGQQSMTMVDWPLSVIYSFVLFGFAVMCFRAIIVMVQNCRRGYSILEKPEAFMEPL